MSSNYTQPHMLKPGTLGEYEPLRGDAQGLFTQPTGGALIHGGSVVVAKHAFNDGMLWYHPNGDVNDFVGSKTDRRFNRLELVNDGADSTAPGATLYVFFDFNDYSTDGEGRLNTFDPHLIIKPGEAWAGDLDAVSIGLATSLEGFYESDAPGTRVRLAMFGRR